jgi:hypothetical protein
MNSVAVGTPEHAREAGPVELNALEGLAALGDTRAVVGVVCGGRPDATVCIDADAVRSDTVRPRTPTGQAAVVVDVEGGEPSGERLRDDQRAVVGREDHPVREREFIGDLARLTIRRNECERVGVPHRLARSATGTDLGSETAHQRRA